MIRVLAVLVLLGALAAGGTYLFLSRPYGGFTDETFVEIPKGTSTRGVANRLAQAGVVRYPWQLLAAHTLRPEKTLQAGEYRFTQPATVWEVMDRLARGDVFFQELRVPEGSNLFDIAVLVGELKTFPAKEFLKAAADPTPIRDLDPRAPSLEGYLFPATYRVTRKMTARQLVHDMTQQFRRNWAQAKTKAGAKGAPATHEVVTLASLVEKESALPVDRPKVASVFANRLRRGMPLDCDPTTIYAALLEERYRGTIYRSDLQSKNLYNTYSHPGLPPGPIANPGLQSLVAALQPAETPYLFFVAKPGGSGKHQFSATLAEHSRAVQEYRRGIQAAASR